MSQQWIRATLPRRILDRIKILALELASKHLLCRRPSRLIVHYRNMSRLIASSKPLCLFVVGKKALVCSPRAISPSLVMFFSSINDTSSSEKRKKSGLYTKTGDSGTSSLYNGERRPKADIVFEVLGHQVRLKVLYKTNFSTPVVFATSKYCCSSCLVSTFFSQDELNAVIGIAREHCALTENGLEEMLKEIQSRLFDLGAAVATPVQTSSSRKKAYTEVTDVTTFQLYCIVLSSTNGAFHVVLFEVSCFAYCHSGGVDRQNRRHLTSNCELRNSGEFEDSVARSKN